MDSSTRSLRRASVTAAARVAVVVGTSTSSIGASEDAYARLEPDGRYPADLRRPIIHTPHSLGDFVQHALGLRGLSVTVATACSSSAKVFAQAERLIRTGIADAAVVGGVDTLCGSVLFGFNSLELVSPDPCRPFDVERRGINLGEAAGFALLEREGPARRVAARLRRIERRASHVDAASRRSRCAPRAASGAGARAAHARRHRLHQSARHGEPEERRSRGASRRRAVSGAHVRQLHQGLDRPRARRGGHRRSGDQPARDRARPAARHVELADARSGLRPADPPRQRGARDAHAR